MCFALSATGLTLGGSSSTLSAFADASWGEGKLAGNAKAGDGIDIEQPTHAQKLMMGSRSRSMSGHLLTLGNSVITWASNTQQKISLSSCESEYHTLLECAKQVLWCRRILDEMGLTQGCTKICEDNQPTIMLIRGAVTTAAQNTCKWSTTSLDSTPKPAPSTR
jgi:hypothetical protein